MLFSAKERILFIGDSITYVGRSDDNPLGTGYVNMIATLCDAMHPELELTCFNRGINGNRVTGLETRWQRDCLDLKCNWVSVMIGVNDVHAHTRGTADLPVDKYKRIYRQLLESAIDACNCKIILFEPYYFATPKAAAPEVADHIGDYIVAVNDLAGEFADHVVFVVHSQELFAKASQRRWIDFWTVDGIHPTAAGHALLACEFLRLAGWELK